MKKPLIIALIAAPLLLLCCCCSGYFALLAYNSPDYSDTQLPFDEFVDEYDDPFEEQFIDEIVEEIDEQVIDELEEEVAEFGTISGILTYPSEFLPLMEICAVNTETDEILCSYDLIEDSSSPSGYGYELQLPPGTYEVYAVEIDENGDYVDGYKAYYSKFVTCGLEASCPSHEPIEVVVVANVDLNNIDPGDWYDPSQ